MYISTDLDESRRICRNHIESLELWSRRLIHEQLSLKYGNDYFNAKNLNGDNIINKSIRKTADKLKNEDPQRFPRHVDTLLLDDIIRILCNPNFYKDLFKEALDINYRQGREEVREYLKRLIPIRNALCHSNPISTRQAEQVICYSNDFIYGVREYYRAKGLETMWNIPQIIKATDSLGNVYFPKIENKDHPQKYFDIRKMNGIFQVGDSYSITLEIDPSFERSDYTVKWSVPHLGEREDFLNSLSYSKTFTIDDVKQTFQIHASITSIESWHKYSGYDDDLNIYVTVLPPIKY